MKVTCPTCEKPGQLNSIREWPYFPFCSYKCKMIDLGRWFDEQYRVPSEERPEIELDAEQPEPPAD
ncbi:MAG: DNA gyrase inhibitor YacG [Gemmataceae bacterium]